MFKLYNDPGHGGNDPGAVANGIEEEDITLAVGLRVRDILLDEYKDVQVKMSRTTDVYPSLNDRTNEANAWGADFLLSLHVNAGKGKGGYEDFIYPNAGSTAVTYQNVIHAEVMRQIGGIDRGKKKKNLHMLRESNMPALLIECAFIDVSGDAKKLKSAAFIEKLAVGHVNGLAKAFGLKKKTTSTKKYHTAKWGETVFRIANKYGVDLEQIKAWNKLDDKYTITIGKKLRVK